MALLRHQKINAPLVCGETVLFAACRGRSQFMPDVVSFLITRNADPSIMSKRNESAAVVALRGGVVAQVVQQLVSQKQTPTELLVEIVSGRPHPDCPRTVQTLIELGAGVNIVYPPLKRRSLHFAARGPGGHLWIPPLLEAAADVNALDSKGWTALHCAAAAGRAAACVALLEGGADPVALNNDVDMPLHLACKGAFFDAAAVLAQYINGQSDVTNGDEMTPLACVMRVVPTSDAPKWTLLLGEDVAASPVESPSLASKTASANVVRRTLQSAASTVRKKAASQFASRN